MAISGFAGRNLVAVSQWSLQSASSRLLLSDRTKSLIQSVAHAMRCMRQSDCHLLRWCCPQSHYRYERGFSGFGIKCAEKSGL